MSLYSCTVVSIEGYFYFDWGDHAFLEDCLGSHILFYHPYTDSTIDNRHYHLLFNYDDSQVDFFESDLYLNFLSLMDLDNPLRFYNFFKISDPISYFRNMLPFLG